jgi:hypothetical protein
MNIWRQAMEITPDSPALRPRAPSEDFMTSSTKLESIMLESKDGSSSSTTATTPPRRQRGTRTHHRRYRTKACQSFNDGLLEVVGVRC